MSSDQMNKVNFLSLNNPPPPLLPPPAQVVNTYADVCSLVMALFPVNSLGDATSQQPETDGLIKSLII